jgi:hypothetical protein
MLHKLWQEYNLAWIYDIYHLGYFLLLFFWLKFISRMPFLYVHLAVSLLASLGTSIFDRNNKIPNMASGL